MKIKTEIEETSNGHTVRFHIDHQSFTLSECESEIMADGSGMTSKEYAEWYEQQLKVAFERYEKSIRSEYVLTKEHEFSDESIKRLNEQQNDDRFHGYTCCGHDGCDRSKQPNWGKLIATKEGWVCPCGKYKQDWYHEY